VIASGNKLEVIVSIASINDTEIFYVTIGQGFPCLVMHGGLGFDHTYLHPWLDPLGDTLQLIYYDHRGNGRSGRPDKKTMSHAQFAADADALASHLGHEKVVVMGHSYGGFIALEFALRHPDRLSHLILLDTAPALNNLEEIEANALRMGATEEMMTVLQESWSTDEEMRQRLEIIWPLYFKNYDSDIAARLVGNCIVSIAGNACEGEAEAYNVTPRLGEIQIPTLVLVGREDFVCPPSQAHILCKGIPNSELVIFEDSGHLPYVEEPGLFFDTVRDWTTRKTRDH
jgi:proline iminopeptidase